MRNVILILTLQILFAGHAALAAPTIDAKARALIKNKCMICHNPDGVGDTIFGTGNDPDIDELVSNGYLAPGDLKQSSMWDMIESNEMPLGKPLKSAEKALIRKWIETMPSAGPARAALKSEAPDSKQEKSEFSADSSRPGDKGHCTSTSDIQDAILKDLESMSAGDREFTRYISLDAFVRPGQDLATEQELIRQAVVKTLNSLSFQRSIHAPVVVRDGDHLALRVDLRSIGWNREKWQLLQGSNPTREFAQPALSKRFQALTGEPNALIAGSAFVNVANRNPLYPQLLGLPRNVKDLKARLGVNVEKNLANGKAARAGFKNSGVSVNNRIIERHPTRFGSYWASYDFASDVGKRDIFGDAVNPPADGGEVIFNLPNGLQGYYLYGPDGEYLAKAPTAVVSDPRRPDHAVENGISCHRCHAQGIIPKTDEILAFYGKDEPLISKLYPSRESMNKLYLTDQKRYAAALDKMKVDSISDPITAVNEQYESDLSFERAICELDTTPEGLIETFNQTLSQEPLLKQLVAKCRQVDRSAFDDLSARNRRLQKELILRSRNPAREEEAPRR